jgi:hypothetical protein
MLRGDRVVHSEVEEGAVEMDLLLEIGAELRGRLSPVIGSTGWWSSLESWRPFTRCGPPGPEVARQTPSLPVALA